MLSKPMALACYFLFPHSNILIRAGEPELGARELGFFEGARAGVIKIFGRSSSYPIIEDVAVVL